MLLGILTAYVPCTKPAFVMDAFQACLNDPNDIRLDRLLNVAKVALPIVLNFLVLLTCRGR